MTAAVSVLHVTAHLGGGVGKAISGLILNTAPESAVHHTVVCLEAPEKTQFLEQLMTARCAVVVRPEPAVLSQLVAAADLVQLEWWGHPATIAALCAGPLPAMRLLVWCHVSGLSTPIIPRRLIAAARRCLFTSPCSYEAAEVAGLLPADRERLAVIHSAGGFAGFEPPTRSATAALAAGYLGSLNFAKLHPRYVEFLAAVARPDFQVRMIGDVTNRAVLEQQCRAVGRPELLEFRGYSTEVAAELAAINVFPYLLNPRHYGTSENALLEAMAMGVVPVVLDNPAERCLVDDGATGLIVRSVDEFAAAIAWLAEHPEQRWRMGLRAAATVRERFAVTGMVAAFARHYASALLTEKTAIDFSGIFGREPADWFLACQRHPELFTDPVSVGTIDEVILPGLLERTKGSVFHYRQSFPDDARLARWAARLEALA